MDLNEMKEDWKDDAPTLAAMEKMNLFIVPESYFQEMERQVMSRVKISAFDNNIPAFSVPQNYFEELEGRITSVNNLHLLKTDKEEDVYSLPEGYFDNLEERIKTKIQLEGFENKIKRLVPSWTVYAAAACITAFISIGIYFNNTNTDNSIETQISAIPADEIVDYLQLYSDAGDGLAIMANLEDESALSQLNPDISEEEIEQYLKLNL